MHFHTCSQQNILSFWCFKYPLSFWIAWYYSKITDTKGTKSASCLLGSLLLRKEDSEGCGSSALPLVQGLFGAVSLPGGRAGLGLEKALGVGSLWWGSVAWLVQWFLLACKWHCLSGYWTQSPAGLKTLSEVKRFRMALSFQVFVCDSLFTDSRKKIK